MVSKPPKGKSLAEVNPELAKEWHHLKNGIQGASDVFAKSGKKVWWKCTKGDDHEWESTVLNRSNGNGCPFCSGQKVIFSNSLAKLNPLLAREWHPSKNGNLKPNDVGIGFTKKVWWQCSKHKQHVWQSNVDNRHRGGKGCPYCANQKVDSTNCLQTLNPELSKEWDQKRNIGISPKDVVSGSGKLAWWVCSKNPLHKWRARIVERHKGKGCPFCANLKVDLTNSLLFTNADIAKEWHPTKNGKTTPSDVVAGSEKRFWWKCPKGTDHEWESTVANRLRAGCPICSNQKIVESNSLAHKLPKLASQWHPTRNGSLTSLQVGTSSNKLYWWKCPNGPDHEWRTTIDRRKAGGGCPFCTLTPQSKQELTITFELLQFFEIDPKGFKTRIDGKLWSIDIYLKEINLGIEFDGSYWHKDKSDLDKLKTQKLKQDGFQIMRIREEPLKPITDIDVVSKRPFNAKQVANDILTHIIQTFDLEKERVQKISKYLMQKDLKNEDALEEYIEMILNEKSANKQKRTKTAHKPH